MGQTAWCQFWDNALLSMDFSQRSGVGNYRPILLRRAQNLNFRYVFPYSFDRLVLVSGQFQPRLRGSRFRGHDLIRIVFPARSKASGSAAERAALASRHSPTNASATLALPLTQPRFLSDTEF